MRVTGIRKHEDAESKAVTRLVLVNRAFELLLFISLRTHTADSFTSKHSAECTHTHNGLRGFFSSRVLAKTHNSEN